MFWYWQVDGWIALAGTLCAIACALVGNFLVLRRLSLIGDAISHAILDCCCISLERFPKPIRRSSRRGSSWHDYRVANRVDPPLRQR